MRDVGFEAGGVLGVGVVGALFTTTRVTRVGAEHYLAFRRRGEPVIFVFWHAQLLPLVHYHRKEGIVVLVSEHADGEYMTRIIRRNGFGAVRGSTTRGATRGLRGLVRAARSGHDLALTPDGPRGPPRVLKPGALAVARVTGLPLIPMAVGASSAWRLSSWDSFLVPHPFARIRIEYLPPVWVPRRATREALEGIGTGIEASLNAATARLEGPEGGGAPGAAPAP